MIQEGDEYYVVGSRFVTVYTTKFSQFICTVCGETICNATVIMFLMASLQPLREERMTSVKVKVFLCSNLFNILDFRNVSSPNIYITDTS